MVFHLSHTDLDGYSCQVVAKNYFKDITFYNSGYGPEIDEKIKAIIKSIFLSGARKSMILITDLNLTLEQAKFITKEIEKLPNEVELLLLDHHKSGEDVANRYPWYHLDVKRSATKITYDYFAKKFGAKKELEQYVEIVDAVDIWQTEHVEFETGKILMATVSAAREINKVMFPKEQSHYIFSIIDQCKDFYAQENAHIMIDKNIHPIKKAFFYDDEDNTLDNLVSNYIVKLLSHNKERMTVTYKGHKGILTYNVGNVSVIGNNFLVKNPEYEFFMDVTNRRTISLRADGKIDVSKMANTIGNGGGHANAAGGLLTEYKDSFIYDNIKSQIDTILRKYDAN